MDPDATLENIRRLCNAIASDPASRSDYADELVEVIEALDHWLSRGGFPPKVWQDTRRFDVHG